MPCIFLHVVHVLGRGNSVYTGVTQRSRVPLTPSQPSCPRHLETAWGVADDANYIPRAARSGAMVQAHQRT